MNKRKIFNWIYRIFVFVILDSFIVVVGFVGLYTALTILQERGLMSLGVSIGLLQMGLAIAYLQIWNLCYWILNINIFTNKLFRWKSNGTSYV